METETQRKIEETVNEILRSADLHVMTEYKVREIASKKLGIDLSVLDHKRFVREVVESYIRERQAEIQGQAAEQKIEEVEGHEKEEEEEEQQGTKRRADAIEYDGGDRIVCHLSSRRRVTIQDFRGKTLISIREYYEKDGKMLPTTKGISLTVDQWIMFKKNVPAIEKTIRKLQR